jgi:hypothetical protein
MGFGHVNGNFFSDFVIIQVGLLQELEGDVNQGISGPWVEPIDGSGVDDTWELSCSDSHCVTNG